MTAQIVDMVVEFLSRDGDSLAIEGHIEGGCNVDSCDVLIQFDSQDIDVATELRPSDSHSPNLIKGFHAKVPLRPGKVTFCVLENGIALKARLKAGKYCPLPFRFAGYAQIGDMMLCALRHDDSAIRIAKASGLRLRLREAAYCKAISLKHPEDAELLKMRRTALKQRRQSPLTKIWLISDRVNMAGDSGEALFTWLQEHPIEGVAVYFAVAENSPDFKRMKQIGPTVAFGSDEHKMLHLNAEFIISSSADESVLNQFGRHRYIARGVERYRFVFLQHGVIKDDLSSWLNKSNKNIALFVTSATRERDSIVQNPAYGYGPEEVLLSGLPRHDRLMAEAGACMPRKRVLIAPTWREYVAGRTIRETGTREENPSFESSTFFEFYNALLNDEKLWQASRELGYEIAFMLHPSFMQESSKFKSPFAQIVADNDYRREYCAASIMLTDYSSAVFDFALLRRPVVYAQFDRDEFFANHLYDEGYFDYEMDGFGPVTYDLASTVQAIIAAMRNPNMTDEYRRRVKEFFFVPPEGQTRCQLVTEAIVSLK